MPKKLQIKLLSQSAELLSVTNCSAGQISVLRAESQSELRPYQRALAGNHGRERFLITVDGSEYVTDQHNLIGCGELAPHAGLTVAQYLASAGLIEGALSGLLMAFGLEGIENKLCSSLSPDEERKVRIFAATTDASKALVLNEPFEPIAGTWRDRIAEFLTDFARTKNGLVVVASLSYRPESWIDNPVIARHQVGQSLRRTIGFGGAGSESNQLIDQLREQIRSESSQASPHQVTPPESTDPNTHRPHTAALSLGAAALGGTSDVVETTAPSQSFEHSTEDALEASTSRAFELVKTGAVVGAGVLGVWTAVSLLGLYPHRSAPSQPSPGTLAAATTQQSTTTANPSDELHPHNASVEDTARSPRAPEKAQVAYIMDRYPEPIRISIVDTSRGVMTDVNIGIAVNPPVSETQKQPDQNGNFYKLLESAGTDKADAPSAGDDGAQISETSGSWNQGDSADITEYIPGEEEERREAIRQKFLEAIRAAAERREQEGLE